MKELPIIVKADVQGSVEAVKQSLEKISNEEVRVKVIHGAVGAVKRVGCYAGRTLPMPSSLASMSVPTPLPRRWQSGKMWRSVCTASSMTPSTRSTDAMKGMLAPKYRDVDLGRAEVRQVYKISSVGTVAGCYVLDGKLARNAKIRVVRDGIVSG